MIAFLDALGYDCTFYHDGAIHPFAAWSPRTIGWHHGTVNNFIFRPRPG